MLIGVIADDFTGASDIANTLAKGVPPEGGLRTAQFPGIPDQDAAPEIEAGVISLKSRSAPVADAVAQSLAALDWLLAQGCKQIVFKYCSTFDSTPQGNIGPVGAALAQALGAKAVVVCPAFPAAGRTVYQGHLFVFDRLLNESGMQAHPLTPMTDPDVCRWLSRQTDAGVGHVAHPVVHQGAVALRHALDRVAVAGHTFCVVDAINDNDLLTVGEAVGPARFVTGGSGVALGLPRNFIRRGDAVGGNAPFASDAGPAAIMAGSCSGATRGQIDLHAQTHPVLAIDVARVMAGDTTAETLVDFILSQSDPAPLVYSSGTPDQVRAIQQKFGRDQTAQRLDSLFADTARLLVRRGYRRIVVAGGETSGAVAQAVCRSVPQLVPDSMGAAAMRLGPEIDPGVPVLSLGSDAPVLLALKSGNFGGPDFFDKALAVMGGTR